MPIVLSRPKRKKKTNDIKKSARENMRKANWKAYRVSKEASAPRSPKVVAPINNSPS